MVKKVEEGDVKAIKSFDLELRKVLALEEIAKSISNISAWLDEIDKEGWDERLQWYLTLVKQTCLDPKLENTDA